MLITLSEAEKITFIGYSLPIDDLKFRNYFRTSIKKDAKIKVVLYDEHYEDSNRETAKRFIAVFGNKVLFNFIGSPECFKNEDI